MSTLAICIPTWCRAQEIAYVLCKELAFLEAYGVDLWIYDSSPDGRTRGIVETYIGQGFGNLIYRRVDAGVSPNMKYFDICESMSCSGYEYLWIIQDHLVFTEDALKHILLALEGGADFYYLDMQSEKYAVRNEQDLQGFAERSAWMLGRFGTAILGTKHFLRGAAWQEMRRKWLRPATLNYSHIGFYFDRLAEREDFKIQTISFPRDCFYDFMRDKPLSWEDEAVRICLECWGETIETLPDRYGDKSSIMRGQDALFLSNWKLLRYRRMGWYDRDAYNRYEGWIEKIYPDRAEAFREIAAWPVEKSEEKYAGAFKRSMEAAAREGCQVAIFGAGRHASECADALLSMGVEFACFLVSDAKGNPAQLRGRPVKMVQEYLGADPVCVVVAIHQAEQEEIMEWIGSMVPGNVRCIGYRA